MASSTPKKTTTTKKKTTAKKTSGSNSAKTSQKRPIRREVGGAVLLLLALFCGVTYFKVSAIFTDLFANLLKGLFGYGYWLAAPAMLLAGIILLFHHGRPVALRVTSTLVLPLLMGSLCHMFLCKETYALSTIGVLRDLWRSGVELVSGGVIAGALAAGAVKLFTKVASVIIFASLFVLLLLVALWPMISKAKKKHQERTRYEEEPERASAVVPALPKETSRRKAEETKQQIDYVSSSNLATAQRLVNTYVNIIKSNSVLTEVIANSDLDCEPADIRRIMSAAQMDETEMFTVSITHPDPEMAAKIGG